MKKWSYCRVLGGQWWMRSGYIRTTAYRHHDDLAFTQNIYTEEKTLARYCRLVQDLDPAVLRKNFWEECLLIN